MCSGSHTASRQLKKKQFIFHVSITSAAKCSSVFLSSSLERPVPRKWDFMSATASFPLDHNGWYNRRIKAEQTLSYLIVFLRRGVIRNKNICCCDNEVHLSYNWIPDDRHGALITNFIKLPEQKLSFLNLHRKLLYYRICCKWSFFSDSLYLKCTNYCVSFCFVFCFLLFSFL